MGPLSRQVAVGAGASRGGGRAILALPTDPNVLPKTGKILRLRDLAQEYGFEDMER